MKSLFIYTILLLTMSTIMSCHCNKKASETKITEQYVDKSVISPAALVYKTKKDYSSNIPVLMNAEKSRIISYPDPSDIYYKGNLSYPTPLIKGFFLDNRGIGVNVAFLTYTYESYSKLTEAPTMEQLMNSLLEKYPLVEMWSCGPRMSFKEEVKELNVLIEQGFPGCKQLIKEPKVLFQP